MDIEPNCSGSAGSLLGEKDGSCKIAAPAFAVCSKSLARKG